MTIANVMRYNGTCSRVHQAKYHVYIDCELQHFGSDHHSLLAKNVLIVTVDTEAKVTEANILVF